MSSILNIFWMYVVRYCGVSSRRWVDHVNLKIGLILKKKNSFLYSDQMTIITIKDADIQVP